MNDLRILSESEMLRIEGWARQTRISEMLSFFEALPRFFTAPRRVLLGSNNRYEILFEGFFTRRQVVEAVSNLDEPFNPHLIEQRILMAKEREESIGVMEAIYRELSNGFEKVCLAEDLGKCRGKIVRAHTLQKAAFQAYACDGHVYEINPFRVDANGHWPTLVGINKATTFTGFCEHHDSSLFRPIEVARFNAQPEQYFLHHYRALALAFYDYVYRAKVLEVAYDENSKKPNIGSLKQFQESIEQTKVSIAEIRPKKLWYEERLRMQQWSSVEGYAWIGTKAPDFFASGFFAPRKDFQGRIVQNCKVRLPLYWLSLTVTATDDRALVLLCAERGSPLLAACVRSLRRLPRDHRTMAVVSYIVCQLENFIMRPTWWEALAERTKRRFVNAYDSRYFPRDLPHVCEWRISEVR